MKIDEKWSRQLRDDKAWQEGYSSGRRGLTDAANPYPRGTVDGLSWRSGLFEGRKKRFDVLDGGRCD